MSQRTKIEQLEEIIKESIVGELVEQQVELLLPPGENFGSVIYKVDFKVKNGPNVETYHAVAKCTPPNKVTQDWCNIQVTIKSEIAWYTTVIPTIRDFQRKHGVKEADFFQTFYGARISLDPNSDVVDLDGVILTENLGSSGYKNINRHIGFDLTTSKAILRDLATFHAVPMAIKIKDKELFDINIKPYLPSFEVKDDPSMQEEKDHFKDVRAGLEVIPEVIPFIDRVIANLEKNRLNLSPSIPQEPWGSVCHNDFWINNIMVKETDIPKTVFLDFQTPAYGSIAIDLLVLLTVSVAQEVISEHMDELIDYYWTEFLKNLEQLNIDSSLFTHEEFLNQIDNEANSGRFGFAFFYNYMILEDKRYAHIDPTDENFEKEDFKRKKFSLNNRHIEKHRWLILEFVKRGWI